MRLESKRRRHEILEVLKLPVLSKTSFRARTTSSVFSVTEMLMLRAARASPSSIRSPPAPSSLLSRTRASRTLSIKNIAQSGTVPDTAALREGTQTVALYASGLAPRNEKRKLALVTLPGKCLRASCPNLIKSLHLKAMLFTRRSCISSELIGLESTIASMTAFSLLLPRLFL